MSQRYKFSKASIRRMNRLHPSLVSLLNLAISRTPIDFGIAWMGGFRTGAEQNKLFNKTPKVTTKDGYINKSKHQSGLAVDIQPYIGGEISFNKENYMIIAGVLFSCANELNLTLKSGMNWDMDDEFLVDQSFDDFPHFEIII